MDEDSGLQLDGVVEIYGEVIGQVYNLLHMHMEDISKTASIKVIQVKNINDYKDFEKDSEGNVLRYKVLVKDGKIDSVLYNTGDKVESIKFKEIQISANEVGNIVITRVVYIEEKKMYGRIISIPTYLLSSETSVLFHNKD